MACNAKNFTLAKHQQFFSNVNGSKKTYWSAPLSYKDAAVFLRAAFSNFAASTSEVRICGRYSADDTTYINVNASGTAGSTAGYIDGRTAAITSATAAVLNFQYTGQPEEHAEFFQIGIEVGCNGTTQASVVMSLDAAFGEAQMQTIDAGVSGTLASSTPPIPVAGAVAQQTAGYTRVRVTVKFQSTPAATVNLYLGTGSLANSRLTVASVSGSISTTSKETSFIVENPANWSAIYYSTSTTPAIDYMEMTLIP